jgi:hypothetical protein
MIMYLTYLLTVWSTILNEKLIGFAANQQIPRILWNSKIHYRTHKLYMYLTSNQNQSAKIGAAQERSLVYNPSTRVYRSAAERIPMVFGRKIRAGPSGGRR